MICCNTKNDLISTSSYSIKINDISINFKNLNESKIIFIYS